MGNRTTFHGPHADNGVHVSRPLTARLSSGGRGDYLIRCSFHKAHTRLKGFYHVFIFVKRSSNMANRESTTNEYSPSHGFHVIDT